MKPEPKLMHCTGSASASGVTAGSVSAPGTQPVAEAVRQAGAQQDRGILDQYTVVQHVIALIAVYSVQVVVCSVTLE